MKPEDEKTTTPSRPTPPTEPRTGCKKCGKASDTMFSRIVAARGKSKRDGPYCQRCWDTLR